MIKIENDEVLGWEYAIRGARNPMNSWKKSDTRWFLNPMYEGSISVAETEEGCELFIGPNDQSLLMKLAKAGSVEAKYRRMIVVYCDITAPLYWWKEFDTYKVGTVANSCSTMHKIHSKEFTFDDFSCEHIIGDPDDYAFTPAYIFSETIRLLNKFRDMYNNEEDPKIKKECWWQMIQLLPSSYNQRRTVMMNYEVLTNIYKNRKDHKLDEWREFCEWIKKLPFSEIITLEEKNG